jgi:hypothetical protein
LKGFKHSVSIVADMTKYEHVLFKGIPFLMDESNTIYTYEISGAEPIAVGTRDAGFFPDWQKRTSERVSQWREDVVSTERGKIRENYKSQKQGRGRKTTRKPVDVSISEGATNTIHGL